MSERSRDDQELQGFLAGESALSRRYRDLADEEPPAHIDSAVLASARWAVGADSRAVGKPRVESAWRRRPFFQWGVPLAMAAVVVLAVALTLTVERDPELERIYDRYDPDRRDLAMSDARGPAEEVTLGAKSMKDPITQMAEKDRVKEDPPPVVLADANAPAMDQEKTASVELSRPAELKKQATSVAVTPAGTEARPNATAKTPAAPASVAAPVNPQPTVTVARQRAVPAQTPAPAPAPQVAAVLGNIAPSTPQEAESVVMAEADVSEEKSELADESFARESVSVVGRVEDSAVAAGSTDGLASTSVDTGTTQRSPEQWVADIEVQLNRGNRELARAAVRKFRQSHPDYALPQRLLELLPESER